MNSKHKNIIYLPHGGGPLPLLGDPQHAGLINFLMRVSEKLIKPSAIIIISAHWEEDQVSITSGANPELFFDYYGFPPESYTIQYPAPGHPGLANELQDLFASAGISSRIDGERGFDHGMFVPLKLMYPGADIPCVQLSLVRGLDPKTHIDVGKILAGVRDKNILIIGSGMSFHNMQAFMSSPGIRDEQSEAFNNWLIHTNTDLELTPEEREHEFLNWESAPGARYCHPREEHLIPLHVCFGAALQDTPIAACEFNAQVMGQTVSAFLW